MFTDTSAFLTVPTPAMTFEQFQATGCDTPDLGIVTGEDHQRGRPGRVYGPFEEIGGVRHYAKPVYLEDTAGWGADDPAPYGRWSFLDDLSRSESQSDNLTAQERRMYEFAETAGIILVAPAPPTSKEPS